MLLSDFFELTSWFDLVVKLLKNITISSSLDLKIIMYKAALRIKELFPL